MIQPSFLQHFFVSTMEVAHRHNLLVRTVCRNHS